MAGFTYDGTPAYATPMGRAYQGDSRDLLALLPDGCVDLALTSPPFALVTQKEYGNVGQSEYVDWLAGFAALVKPKLKPTGSLVIDVGGSYVKGTPTRSLLNFRLPLRLCDDIGYHLAQEFFWFDPTKLASPAEWVGRGKVRAKDSVNTVWWLSPTPWPKADVGNVLTPYGKGMRALIARDGNTRRPCGHQATSWARG